MCMCVCFLIFQSSAGSVYTAVNGTPYSSLEEEICKLAFVSRVESMKNDVEIGLPLLGTTCWHPIVL